MAWLRMALKNREITWGLKRRNISSGTECKNSKKWRTDETRTRDLLRNRQAF